MEVRGIIKKRSKTTKISLILILLIIIGIEILTKKYVYLFLSFFVLMALFLEKAHIVTDKEINIQYHLFGKPIDNKWTWEDLTALGMDYKKEAPHTLVYFGKGMATRAFIMKKEDAKKIGTFVKKNRPDIWVDKWK